ncbi:unnamed protein product [Absidia cylindrospora]
MTHDNPWLLTFPTDIGAMDAILLVKYSMTGVHASQLLGQTSVVALNNKRPNHAHHAEDNLERSNESSIPFFFKHMDLEHRLIFNSRCPHMPAFSTKVGRRLKQQTNAVCLVMTWTLLWIIIKDGW